MTADLNSQDIIFALDIGTRTVIGTAGIVKNKNLMLYRNIVLNIKIEQW
jgi:hypothetical protein